MTRPLAWRISSTASTNDFANGPRSAATKAAMPLLPASSVRSAD